MQYAISFLADNVLVDFLNQNKSSLSEDQRQSIQAMFLCHDPSQGYTTFQCPNCLELKVIHHSCNSRLCPSCGRRLTEEWANRISRRLLHCNHRHVVFTLPDEIWALMLKDRRLIGIASKEILATVCSVFETFLNNIKILPGIVAVLHTFGEDLKFNVHFHCMVTCGGLNDDGDWIDINYFPYMALRKVWQYHVLTAIKAAIPKSCENSRFIHKMFTDHPNGFYVRAKDTVKNDRGLLLYIARYVRHPAIAQSRIQSFDGKTVVFSCKKHEDREARLITMGVQEFLTALVRHIPPKGYQLVKHVGLYANKSRKRYASVISNFQKTRKIIQRKLFSRAIRCEKCKIPMEMLMICAPTDPPIHLLLSSYENQTRLLLVPNLRR